MFNNYANLSYTRYTMIDMHSYDHAIIELMIEQQFATSFDDIYTMHVYRDNLNSFHYVVDVAFELHTNQFFNDDDDNEQQYELIHSFDQRVNVDISSNEIDYDEICNTIEFVKFEIVHRNAYTTRTYV